MNIRKHKFHNAFPFVTPEDVEASKNGITEPPEKYPASFLAEREAYRAADRERQFLLAAYAYCERAGFKAQDEYHEAMMDAWDRLRRAGGPRP